MFNKFRYLEHSPSPRNCARTIRSDMSASSLTAKNGSVSTFVEKAAYNKKVTNKPGSAPHFSYAEVARLSPLNSVIQSTLSISPKNIDKNNKSASRRGCSGVSVCHHAGQVTQSARASVITPSLFLPTQNSPSANSILFGRGEVCLLVVPPRKARLAPHTSAGCQKGSIGSHWWWCFNYPICCSPVLFNCISSLPIYCHSVENF